MKLLYRFEIRGKCGSPTATFRGLKVRAYGKISSLDRDSNENTQVGKSGDRVLAHSERWLSYESEKAERIAFGAFQSSVVAPMCADVRRGHPRDEPLKAQWATIIHYEKDIFHFPLPHSFDVRAKGFFEILNWWEWIYWMDDKDSLNLVIFRKLKAVNYEDDIELLFRMLLIVFLNSWAVLFRDKD